MFPLPNFYCVRPPTHFTSSESSSRHGPVLSKRTARTREVSTLQTSGQRGLISLGSSSVHLGPTAYSTHAIAVGWEAPHFLVRTSGGHTQALSSLQTSSSLNFNPREFANPKLFYDDFSIMHPVRFPGWLEGRHQYTSHYSTSVPSVWLRRSSQADGGAASVATAVNTIPADAASRSSETAFLREKFLKYADDSGAESTVSNCGNAGLKLLCWRATRGHALPLSGPSPNTRSFALHIMALLALWLRRVQLYFTSAVSTRGIKHRSPRKWFDN